MALAGSGQAVMLSGFINAIGCAQGLSPMPTYLFRLEGRCRGYFGPWDFSGGYNFLKRA